MKKIVVIACLLLSNYLLAQPVFRDAPAVHGMLLFGTEKIYASHLPMFHPPHDYQIILEVELDKNAKANYLKSRKEHPAETVYTIEPEKFSIPKFMQSTYPIKVNLFRGHFERGGQKILDSITIAVSQTIYYKHFDQYAEHKKTMTYILFGNKKEQFVAHEISGPADFDQIIQVKTNKKPINRQLENSNSYAIAKVEKNNNQKPFSGTKLKTMLVADKQALELDITSIIYTETEDLDH
jgi:hypothetical protein